MRLVFMGTPDFAVPSLDAVVEAGFPVVGVVTQPDRPKGRGMRLAASPVKLRAQQLGLPVLQPEKVRESDFLASMQQLRPDAIAVVAFGQLIPPALLELPPYGCINVHPSLLPLYRGAIPIQQALMDGVTYTGVTTMYLDAGMDTGDIILQERVTVQPDEDAGHLHDRLALVGARLLVQSLQQIEAGTAPRIAQDSALATVTKRLQNADAQVKWSSATAIANQVRALSPWPGAFTFYAAERVKIWQASAADELPDQAASPPGTILAIETDSILVSCAQGIVRLLLVQPENGSRMDAAAYARGRHLVPGDQFA